MWSAIAWEALGKYEKSREACEHALASLTRTPPDKMTAELRRKARQEAESRMKTAILKQLAAPAKPADIQPPDSLARWHCAGSNPNYPALAGKIHTKSPLPRVLRPLNLEVFSGTGHLFAPTSDWAVSFKKATKPKTTNQQIIKEE